MNDKLGNNITDSVERVLRYIIPGVLFGLLFALSYPCKLKSIFPIISGSGLATFLIIITLGISIYTIHSQLIRFTLELLAFVMDKSPVNLFCKNNCLCNYSKALSELLIYRNKSETYPKEYYIYLWSIVHYSFIMSYLFLFFSFFNEPNSWAISHDKELTTTGIVILILSFCSYFYMQILEKNTTAVSMSKPKNVIEKEDIPTEGL